MAPLGCLSGPEARGSTCSLQEGGWEPGRVIPTCMAVCMCVVTYAACISKAICDPGYTFVCGQFARACLSVCAQMNVCVPSLCLCVHICVHAEVPLCLNFKFPFIQVCVLMSMKEKHRERENDGGE